MTESSSSLLEIRDLDVRFTVRGGQVHAVRGLDLTVHRGEVAAVVGESGSGKSASMLAALGLLDVNAVASGSVRFDGVELLRAPQSVLRGIRGGRVGMIFQDPMTSLNPVLEIRRQIAEAVITHQHVTPKQAESRAVELLELVSFPDAARRARSYPHELSGGMRQRVMIAMALANDPSLLIALITHDLGVVAGLADTVHVMYAGSIAESGPVVDIFHRPQHPYTAGLLASLPRLDRPDRELTPIGGVPPRLYEAPVGCAFAQRCQYAIAACSDAEPTLRPVNDSLVACVVLPMAERTTEGAR